MNNCDLCKRTFRGFVRYLWGMLWYPAFTLFGAKWFLKYGGGRSVVGRFIVSQFGWARNPEWPSRNEIDYCSCHTNQ